MTHESIGGINYPGVVWPRHDEHAGTLNKIVDLAGRELCNARRNAITLNQAIQGAIEYFNDEILGNRLLNRSNDFI